MNRIPYPIVKLERHKSINTNAETFWKVKDPDGIMISLAHAEEMGYIKYLLTTEAKSKTHWEEYYAVLNPFIKFVKVRISNRGNMHTEIYKPEELEVKGIERDIVENKSNYYFKEA
jgi:hypothetical protein